MHALRSEPGHLECCFGRCLCGLETGKRLAIAHRQIIAPLTHPRQLEPGRVAGEQDGRRAVGNRTAVPQPQRVGDHAAAHHFFERNRLLKMRVRVARAIRMVLDGYARHVCFRDEAFGKRCACH